MGDSCFIPLLAVTLRSVFPSFSLLYCIQQSWISSWVPSKEVSPSHRWEGSGLHLNIVGDPEKAVKINDSVFLGSEVVRIMFAVFLHSCCCRAGRLVLQGHIWVTCKRNSVEKPLYLEPPCGDFLHYQSFLTNTVFATESIFFLLLISANHTGNLLGILNPFYMTLGSLRVLLFSVSLLNLAVKNSECGCSLLFFSPQWFVFFFFLLIHQTDLYC